MWMIRETVRSLLALAAAGALAGCPSVIKQDSKTGTDGTAEGAEKIELSEEGEGSVKDNVTYPGGDRVDWKMFELPGDGIVEVDLKWTSPRPNLDLSMNILDDTFNIVKRIPPEEGSGKTRKSTEITGVQKGTYYVQVYASGRGDAGDYTLDITYFKPRPIVVEGPPLPNPPRLPAIPGATPAADGGAVAVTGAGPKGSATNPCKVGENCPPGAAYINPACPDAPAAPIGTPCPPPPTINPMCPDAGLLAPGAPCPPAKPRAGRIIEKSLSGQEIVVTIDKGQNQGITKGWTGVVFVGRSGTKVVPNSEFAIFKVTEDESYGKIRRLSLDELGANVRVELRAPPAAP
jgi:hypothetical protein